MPEPVLQHTEQGLQLVAEGMTVRGDFTRMLPRIAAGKLQRELLVRAARIKGADGCELHAIDATAGLGDDSFLLAAAGFDVALYERDETIAALLADALERAACDERLAPIVARMHLTCGDSILALQELNGSAHTPPDVVLLDPMFPEKHHSSSAKKKLQLLQMLEQPCENEEALLEAALAAHSRKVVVKRPIKGPTLANRAPSYSLRGKAIRYDVYVQAH